MYQSGLIGLSREAVVVLSYGGGPIELQGLIACNHCTSTVLPLYCQGTVTVLPACFRCTATGLQLYCHCQGSDSGLAVRIEEVIIMGMQ